MQNPNELMQADKPEPVLFRRVKPLSDIINRGNLPRIDEEATTMGKKTLTLSNAHKSKLSDRYRATTMREASGLRPVDSRLALRESRAPGKRISLLFTPGFGDMVNDTVRMSRDRAILSDAYRQSDAARSLFMKQVVQDRHGIDVPLLTRRLDHVNYMRVDFKEVLMFHPSGWGFPEADFTTRIVGKQLDPAYGWLRQKPVGGIDEMDDVSFSYNSVIRMLPPQTIGAICTGKTPDWLREISKIDAEPRTIAHLRNRVGDDCEVHRLLEAGLVEPSKVYIKMAELAFPKIVEPELLSADLKLNINIKGIEGLRLYLTSRLGSSLPVTPFQIDTIAFQLGIHGEYHYYWVCLFVLRLPLPLGWVVELKNDIRTYCNLRTGHRQRIHPYQDQFLWMAQSLKMSQIVWDSRGVINFPCDDCGAPDSVVFCIECTGFQCASCFHTIHKKRKRHYAYPYSGCRYLTEQEVADLTPLLHLTNVGFCNRRRFLARTNQSDKTGACQCEWLHFNSIEAFNSISHFVTSQEVERQIIRSVESGKGFYFNFAKGTVTANPEDFLVLCQTQQSMALRLQACFRGHRLRLRLSRETKAAIVIQKNVRMWIAQCRYRLIGRGGPFFVWATWFDLHQRREAMERGITKVQALARMIIGKNLFDLQKKSAIKIQALVRRWVVRNRKISMEAAALEIQRVWRGKYWGTDRVLLMHTAARAIQALARGHIHRMKLSSEVKSVTRIQALCRGFLTREREGIRNRSAVLIQTWWRRFVAVVHIKFDLVHGFQAATKDFEDQVRLRAARSACIMIQKRFRGYMQRKKYLKKIRDLKTLANPIRSVVSALSLAACGTRDSSHVWLRYLSEPTRERIGALKGIIQNGICRSANGHHLAFLLINSLVRRFVRMFFPGSSDSESAIFMVSHAVCYTFANTPGKNIPVKQDRVDVQQYAHPSDKKLRIENISFSGDLLHDESTLSQAILVPLRGFLNQSKLQLESRLAFHGMDTVSANQLRGILSYELGLELPPSSFIDRQNCKEIVRSLQEWIFQLNSAYSRDVDVRKFTVFSQDEIYECWRSIGSSLRVSPDQNAKERYMRHLTELTAIIDGCNEDQQYIACVVFVHIAVRGLLIRELWQRAATVIQTKFRYFRSRTLVNRMQAPAIMIQKHLRGLRVALQLARKDKAAAVIQANFRIIFSRRRNQKLLHAVRKIQACWRGAIIRKHLSRLSAPVIRIQKAFRGHLVRLFIGTKEGRVIRSEFARKIKEIGSDPQLEQAAKIAHQEAVDLEKRSRLSAKRNRARIIGRRLEQYRKVIQSKGSANKVSRISVFEPMCFARRRVALKTVPSPPVRSEIVTAADSLTASLDRSFLV